MAAPYAKSVFINCPLDNDHRGILEAFVFAIHDCGFTARCALEKVDAGEVRIDKIKRLIRESQFGIHDISRTKPDLTTGLPRFNMPLELGLFMGAKAFGGGRQQLKISLIFERRQYSYQKYCSDIGGQDIAAHGLRPGAAITRVRDWLSTHARHRMPGGADMAKRFRKFDRQLPALCRSVGLQRQKLTFTDYQSMVTGWLEAERQALRSMPGPVQ